MTLKTHIAYYKLTGKNLKKKKVLISHEYIYSFTKKQHHLKRCYYITGSEIATQLNMM